MTLEPITASAYAARIAARFADILDKDCDLAVYRGWMPILEDAFASAERIVSAYGATVRLHNVKQKLGELRISFSVAFERQLWCGCKEPEHFARIGNPPVDGRIRANNHAVRYALEAAEPLWLREGGGTFVPDVEEALRQHAVWSLVEGVFSQAVGTASQSCEFCGMWGQLDVTNGYAAVACADHAGPGRQPMHRGDEFADGFVEPERLARRRAALTDATATEPRETATPGRG